MSTAAPSLGARLRAMPLVGASFIFSTPTATATSQMPAATA